ncbi:hypothetical protein DACRYDRAFT_102647 [Dacryopinax primogenitus]|uniref:Uncharacterized protein n=1 Tax=Dacryopinax primogenitus (strain DJM 731) TaxID=1858805 RepID=M5FPA5_DACPD|nr:uncharacterized protein DACRYDRAFT_102647 [Dacryopinax primogenitus]EJT96928.1 hypothetical protein DACRYDRAFT_102647 [Dacryopinax primogenitus]
MVPQLPVELHRRIYAMACTDDGTTACALSLVSHAVREVVEEFRWFSLAVAGERQVQTLLETLQDVPKDRLKVAHLFVSDLRRPLSYRRREKRMLSLLEREELSEEDETFLRTTMGSLDFSIGSKIVIHLGSIECIEPPSRTASQYIMWLLRLLAPDLITLSLVVFSDQDDAFESTPLRINPSRLTSFPPLVFCALTPAPSSGRRMSHFRSGTASSSKPSRTHPSPNFKTIKRLLVAMGLRPPTSMEEEAIRNNEMDLFPHGVERFCLVEPGPTNFTSRRNKGSSRGRVRSPGFVPRSYLNMVMELEDVADELPNFALLPKHSGHNKQIEAEKSRQQWMERIEGGQGCWVTPAEFIAGL